MKNCITIDVNGFPIKLQQSGKDSFHVTYGKQVMKFLTYPAAAAELGSCIMHALACEGKLDNRQKGEK